MERLGDLGRRRRIPSFPWSARLNGSSRGTRVNVTDRFTRDKTDSLQHAFFNGEGYATLENLWGFWYGMTPRDAETVLRITKIERAFPESLTSAEWEPHVPTLQAGVFASTFPTANSTLWTIVNRNEYDVTGEQLRVPHSTPECIISICGAESNWLRARAVAKLRSRSRLMRSALARS